MKILYYDCFSGISGDMNLGAMIDLGVDPGYLCEELSKLGLEDEFELNTTSDMRKGIVGTRVNVVLKQQTAHTHEHATPTGVHHHGNGDHFHRNLKDIESIIGRSRLGAKVQQTSHDIFRKLALAEAKVHGKSLYEVHFHEVGATDSIVDIVGAAICFHQLEIDEVWCSAIELGGGFVECAHGIMPVPAPATVEILQGVPTTRGAVKKETTTPTGAAILATLVDQYTDSPKFSVEKTGYGIGHRDTKIPNVLRVHMATAKTSSDTLETVPACLLQCNIDDMTPEMLGVVMDLLMDAGAMDVHFTPVLMKKNRPATSISVLCSAAKEEKFKRLLFKHTTTLGIKRFWIEKTVLPTIFETLETRLGNVTVKKALMDGRVIRSKPELEDCRKIARNHDLSLREVYVEIGKQCQS
jgi:hypothetical protein